MPTFIDESGDAGAGVQSAPYFRLGAVYFERPDQIPGFVDQVASLRTKIGKPRVFEFHFSRISHECRVAFFEAISEQPFHFVVCSLEKDRFERSKLTKDGIRELTIERLLSHLGPTYRATQKMTAGTRRFGERIIYDECDDPSFQKILNTKFRLLRGEADQRLIKDIKPGKSKSDSCIQLADMVCGAVGRYLQGQTIYLDLIASRKDRDRNHSMSKEDRGDGPESPVAPVRCRLSTQLGVA